MFRSEANAIDPTGRFAAGTAGRSTGGGGSEVLLLLWDRQRLTTVESALISDVADVNAQGVVVGNGWVNGAAQPWRYRDGKLAPLPLPQPDARDTNVVAINATGDMVGSSSDPVTGQWVPLRWPANRPGTVEVIDAPAGTMPTGLTSNGTIVGNTGDWGDWTGWVRYPNGRTADLTAPGARAAQVHTAAGRWAIGWVDTGGQAAVRVRWNLRDGSYATFDESLVDVNARGVMVGGDRVVRNTSSRVLPGGSDRVNVGARAISDNGTIVGFRNDREHRQVSGVIWRNC
ncbi:hypothetical protein ABZ807_20125 [Micromonospora sp. NPDC047548]|uniref:hypothetical protein n=1 Tax=Micromonospora sp. NPDC047548 TaxID=3155624 RepID=UPI0033ECA313